MTNIPVLYSLGNAPEWLQVAKQFRQLFNWEPVYWLTVDLSDENVSTHFPQATRHNLSDLNRCISTPENSFNSAYFLDEAELLTFVSTEQRTLELMDRMSLNDSFSHRERQVTYFWLLSFWLHTLDKYKPQVVVFNAPPHSPAELVLHDVCQHMGLKVRIYTPTQLVALHLMLDNFVTPAPLLASCYKKRLEDADTSISSSMEKEVRPIMDDDGSNPWYVEAVGEREKHKANLKKKIYKELDEDPDFNIDLIMEPEPGAGNAFISAKGKISDERKERRAQRIRRVFKQPGKSLSAPILRRGSYSDYQIWAYIQKVRLERAYDSLTKPVNKDRKYILLAMHYQPERTSCPDAGRFNNQLLVASLIAQLLPENWQLIIKEHPSQFSFGGEGEMSRAPQDYKNLARLPNTQLAPRHHATNDLVRDAQAVVTLTGFVGVEALLRSVPTIVFGAAWYRDCRGVSHVKTKAELKAAIEVLENGERPNLDEVLMFLGALEDAGKCCYSNTSFSDAIDISSEQLVERLTGLMTDFEALKASTD